MEAEDENSEERPERPRRRRRPEYDDEPMPRKRSKTSPWVIVLICLGAFCFCLLPVGVGLLLPAVQKVREAANRQKSQADAKMIAIAVYNYESRNGALPPPAIVDANGKPLLSWRVAILPFIEQENLYSQFKLNEPWDSPNNRPLVNQMPKLYGTAGTMVADMEGKTYLRVYQGKGTMFDPTTKVTSGMITDGTTNTLMFVEAADPVFWTKPDELKYNPGEPIARPGSERLKGKFLAVMADGSVYSKPTTVSDAMLRAVITRDGQEIVGSDW